MVDDWLFRNHKRLWEMKIDERKRLDDFSDALDKKIEEDMKKENIVPPEPSEIIKENPPLPELDVIKFALERGNDEIALWLKQGKAEGYLDEVMIGIALMKYDCPMIYEPEYSCLVHKETWKELFHHFKNMHYGKDAELRHAKQLYYNMYVSRFVSSKTTPNDEADIRRRASEPSTMELKPYIKCVENRLKWRDTAYAMLQECFVFEANANYTEHSGPRSPKTKKRASVLYRFQKVYGLTTKQIAKIFDYSLENTRKNIYSGMMHEHGNSDKNLPAWMQKVLKPEKDSN